MIMIRIITALLYLVSLPATEHTLELSQTLISLPYIYMGDVIWSQGIVQVGSTAR